MAWIAAGVWLVGGLLRIYRFARFFQIEEYQAKRFFHWLIDNKQRWGWRRPVIAWSGALVLSVLLAETENVWVLTIIYVIAAGVAIWPPRETEVKKKFVRTQRATRLLMTSFLLYGAVSGLAYLLLAGIASALFVFVAVTGAGLLLFLLAPLFLIAGNVAVQPVEAGMRRLYLRRARGVLHRLQPTVIGITGSYGKTSTKHYLAHILNGRYNTVATPKSYNTLMGVTLAINTVLQEQTSVDYFLVEMGAYIEGEIAEICGLAQPQISIVTAVGPQHLERFGSLDAVANAKYEIVDALPSDGVAILNGDDGRVAAMAEWAAVAQTVLVSQDEDTNEGTRALFAKNIQETADGLSFDVVETQTGAERHFHAPLYGRHTVTNLLLATAAARQVGISLGEIAMRVAGLEPFEHRLARKIQPGGLIVLDDAYSANPVGAANALRVLGLHESGKRIVITPGMVELGAVQDDENRKLGEVATAYATDIVLVGIEQTRPIYEGVRSTTFTEDHLHVFATHAEAVNWLRENAQAGDTVLFLNDLPDTYL
ncbi:UDP-N-acetylmuramoyl-tripeptide--D-alanyl-D-alanine ligase [Chloroflexota bacterium]